MGPWSVVRWVRAASFAATCAVLAVLGHVAGGGSPDPVAALAGFLIVLVPALALTGRERTLASIVPATAVSQVVLHVLLTVAAGPNTSVDATAAPAGDVHHGGTPGVGMLLMHAVSMLVTSAWLEWGEARLCAFVRQLAGWAVRPLLLLLILAAGRVGAVSRPAAFARTDQRARAQALLRYAVVRRGPPGTWHVPGTFA
ncbi:MFS transporter [Spirillospora sp. CA-255316]